MTISELMDVLSTAQNKHGDLDVFVVVGAKEYVVEGAFRAAPSPSTKHAPSSTIYQSAW